MEGSNGKPKVVAQIMITVYENSALNISASTGDQLQIRSWLHIAEEMVINTALTEVSKKSNIIPVAALPKGMKVS
jgi:hypothetical protein